MMRRFLFLLICAWLIAWPVSAQTVIPQPIFQGFDNNGDPISGGKLCVYVGGTTTPANTYTTSSLITPNANPVILNSAGRAIIFLTSGQTYKFVLLTAGTTTDCTTGATIWTVDNVAATPTSANNLQVLGTFGATTTATQAVYLSDGSGGKSAGQWYPSDTTNPYSSTIPIIGISISGVASGTVGAIELGGQVTGLSSLSVGATYYLSTTGNYTTTVAANKRVLGVADTTTSLILTRGPGANDAASPTTVSSTATGTQDDFAPGLLGNTILRMNNASAVTIDGFAGGYSGQRITIQSVGAGVVNFANQNSGSAAGNRLINWATSAVTPLAAGFGAAEYIYDATTLRWRLVAHNQGQWITPTFSAGNYTAGGSQTWTVTSGEVSDYKFYLSGNKLDFAITVQNSTVAGTPATTLRAAVPGGFTIATGEMEIANVINDNAGGFATGDSEIVAGNPYIVLYKAATLTGNWSAATTATSVYTSGSMAVQ